MRLPACTFRLTDFSGDLTDSELDPDLLMWDVRRRLDTSRAPRGRTVVRFHFPDQSENRRSYWLVVEGDGQVDLCWHDPGHPVDLVVETELTTMTVIWVGDYLFDDILKRQDVKLTGSTTLRRSFPGWLGLSLFAVVQATWG